MREKILCDATDRLRNIFRKKFSGQNLKFSRPFFPVSQKKFKKTGRKQFLQPIHSSYQFSDLRQVFRSRKLRLLFFMVLINPSELEEENASSLKDEAEGFEKIPLAVRYQTNGR